MPDAQLTYAGAGDAVFEIEMEMVLEPESRMSWYREMCLM